jgi:putative addiction module killer protein
MTSSISIREFIDENERSTFAKWFDGLNIQAATKVTIALTRLELSNFSNVKGVGEGVLEYRIDFGPGYRIYFGKEGNALVILLCGGTKSGQDRDIKLAKQLWKHYKQLKKGV